MLTLFGEPSETIIIDHIKLFLLAFKTDMKNAMVI